MLESLTFEDFSGRVGEGFRLEERSGVVELTLVEVTDLARRENPGPRRSQRARFRNGPGAKPGWRRLFGITRQEVIQLGDSVAFAHADDIFRFDACQALQLRYSRALASTGGLRILVIIYDHLSALVESIQRGLEVGRQITIAIAADLRGEAECMSGGIKRVRVGFLKF
jgi:hypothetical protein